ncbi:MAG: HIRAN domain-containing protein [Lachnospiraceae bacterium]|jgi:HIRAN domain.|nr:HIRAN domain-containing protein [Lachnospiraceae bacterium]
MANDIVISSENAVSLAEQFKSEDLIKPLQKEIFLFDTFVAGTMHIEDESIIKELKSGEKLSLRREPKNRFDENAVRVDDEKGRKLGYVPEKDNYVFARLMDAGKMLIGRVTDIKAKTGYTQVSMAIYLIDF